MDAQELTALAIVAVAALFLGRYLWREVRGAQSGKGCPGCGGCDAARPNAARGGVREAPQATPLITLSTGGRPARPHAPRKDSAP